MIVRSETAPPETVAELLHRLGDIPPGRVRLQPPPGTATEADVIALASRPDKILCELIDGTLVEKVVGFSESQLAIGLAAWLFTFVRDHNLGIVAGADGMLRLFPNQIRIPDVSFVSWERFPQRRRTPGPIPAVAPDLAVEVLSESNTGREMAAKRVDYFGAGTRLVWEIDPEARTVAVYESADAPVRVLTAADTLTGEPALPGFAVPLAELFAELDRHG